MRILLVCHQFLPRYSSGTEVLTRDTGIELSRRGHEVHVLTCDPRPGTRFAGVEVEEYEYAGLQVHSLRLPGGQSEREQLEWEYLNPIAADQVAAYAQSLQPDTVHIFHLLNFSASVIGPLQSLEVPLVFTATDFWSFCVRGNLTKPSGELCRGPDGSNCLECRRVDEWFPPRILRSKSGRRRYFKRVAAQARAERPDELKKVMLARVVLARTQEMHRRISQADAILAPTRLTLELLIENGFERDRVRLSPYGVDSSQFRAARERHLATLDREPAHLRIGFIGTLAEHKGLHVLIDAFRRLGDPPGVTLRICGGLGDFPDYSRSVLAAIAQHPRINLAGRFSHGQMAEELERIDVLVVPSTWYENAPLVVYSALAAGVPVVATGLGGLSELVVDGVNGLLFGIGDAAGLAKCLERLRSEPGLLARLVEGTSEGRSVQDSVDEFVELYEQLARKQAAVV